MRSNVFQCRLRRADLWKFERRPSWGIGLVAGGGGLLWLAASLVTIWTLGLDDNWKHGFQGSAMWWTILLMATIGAAMVAFMLPQVPLICFVYTRVVIQGSRLRVMIKMPWVCWVFSGTNFKVQSVRLRMRLPTSGVPGCYFIDLVGGVKGDSRLRLTVGQHGFDEPEQTWHQAKELSKSFSVPIESSIRGWGEETGEETGTGNKRGE
jgi:hypothetical protein